MNRLIVPMVALASLATAPAGAVTFFSLGGAPDPGVASFETVVVSFDTANAPGIVETNSGIFATAAESIGGVRAAPAGGNSKYRSLGINGSSTFNLTGLPLFASLRSLSVYLGSVDLYNRIEVLGPDSAVIKTINGIDLPGNNGDQGLAITNRRLYINFQPIDQVQAVRFSSTGVAFEFDDIAVSRARFRAPLTPTPNVMPPASVPEPASWAMLVIGFGLVGSAARRRSMRRQTAG
jgi:hypothetical protein